MPRPNRPRSITAEANLAQRLAVERDRRGWTYEGLAERMEREGCSIQGSALFKVEKGRPPRRVTVDELAALSIVFQMPLQQLISDPAGDLPAEGWDLYERTRLQGAVYAESQRIADEEFQRLLDFQIDYNQFVEDHPEAVAAALDNLSAVEDAQESHDRLRGELRQILEPAATRARGRANAKRRGR